MRMSPISTMYVSSANGDGPVRRRKVPVGACRGCTRFMGGFERSARRGLRPHEAASTWARMGTPCSCPVGIAEHGMALAVFIDDEFDGLIGDKL